MLPKLVAAISMNVTMIWYMIALVGSTPAKISPDIIPGRLTRPTVFAESMVGLIPVRIASRTTAMAVWYFVAPRDSRSSKAWR